MKNWESTLNKYSSVYQFLATGRNITLSGKEGIYEPLEDRKVKHFKIFQLQVT